jgi:hypothetical protein
MYEIGKAPENTAHPDHEFALELSRAFWAALPRLDPKFLASLLATRRNLSAAELEELVRELRTENTMAALARIACAYDGGQLES